MDQRIKMIYDSFTDLSAEMADAFNLQDIELIRYQFFRAHRLVAKTMEHPEKRAGGKGHLAVDEYARCASYMKSEISKWYGNLANFYSQQNMDEESAREWFSAITESDAHFEVFIQYAHAALKTHNLYVNREIKDMILRISPSNVKDVLTCLRRVKVAVNTAVKAHGMKEEAGYIISWCNELEKAIESREDLADAIIGAPENITLEKALAGLDKLIGLEEVKQKIYDITNWVSFNKLRNEQGFKSDEISLHMVFSGNPGTGKTTVARLVANILKAVGVLTKGHLVEVGRSDLVAEYVGQTAVKTMNKIKEARGGILFIDEAYSLVRGSASSDFGIEAIDTLVKAMEDERKNLVVILAGYPKEMDGFIASNPGLQSRFKNQIEFPDYSLEELMEIANVLLKDRDYRLTDGARAIFRRMAGKRMLLNPDTHGNGRLVRNLIEDAIMAKASRVMELKARQTPLGELDLIDEDIMGKIEFSKRQPQEAGRRF